MHAETERVRLAKAERVQLAMTEQARQAAAGGGSHCGGLRWRSDCPAVLGFKARRETPFVRFAHCGQTVPASQIYEALRAALKPALLGATQVAPAGCRLPR